MSQNRNKIIKELDSHIQTSKSKLSQRQLKMLPKQGTPSPYKADFIQTYRQHQPTQSTKKKQYEDYVIQNKILQEYLQKKVSFLTSELNKQQLKTLKLNEQNKEIKIAEYQKRIYELVEEIEENMKLMEQAKKQNFQLQKNNNFLQVQIKSHQKQISELIQQKIQFQQQVKNLKADLKATLTYIQQLKESIKKNKDPQIDHFQQRQIRVIQNLYKELFPFKEIEEQVKIMDTMTNLSRKILIDESLEVSEKLIRSLHVQLKSSVQKFNLANNQNKYLKQRLQSFDHLKQLTNIQSQIIKKLQIKNSSLEEQLNQIKCANKNVEVSEQQLQRQSEYVDLLEYKLQNHFKTAFTESQSFKIGKIRSAYKKMSGSQKQEKLVLSEQKPSQNRFFTKS